MNNMEKIITSKSHFFKESEISELKTIIAQAKTDDVQLVQLIGKTVERFLQMRLKDKITYDEFKGSIESVLYYNNIKTYTLPETNKLRVNNIIEKFHCLLFQNTNNVL